MSLFERIYPACHADIYLLYREREQYLADYGAYILLAKIKTVHGHYLCVIALGKFARKFFSLGGIGILRVEYDHKRLSEFTQFIYDTLLALLVLTSRNVRNRAVRGDNKAYRGVLGYHLLRTDLGSHIKRNFLIKPRCHDHSRLFVFYVAYRAWNDIAHAVDKANIERSSAAEVNSNSLLGNEFRLCGHDSLSRRRLRKFVKGAFTHRIRLDIRNNERLHEFLDKRRLSRADRADYAYVNIAVCALGDVAVNIFNHTYLPHVTIGIRSIPPSERVSEPRSFSSITACAEVL